MSFLTQVQLFAVFVSLWWNLNNSEAQTSVKYYQRQMHVIYKKSEKDLQGLMKQSLHLFQVQLEPA